MTPTEDSRKKRDLRKIMNRHPSISGYGLVFGSPSTLGGLNIFSLSFVISSISFSACCTSERMAFTCIPVRPVIEQLIMKTTMGNAQMPHYQMQPPRAILFRLLNLGGAVPRSSSCHVPGPVTNFSNCYTTLTSLLPCTLCLLKRQLIFFFFFFFLKKKIKKK